MTAERDELAKAIYDGLHHEDSDVYADAIGGDLDDVIVDGRVDLLAVADMLLAAGYRKPRVVTTAAELDALPGWIWTSLTSHGGRSWVTHASTQHDVSPSPRPSFT